MPASAFLLAFAAAWIHGAGNVIAGHRREPEAAFAVMLVVGVIAFAPVAILTWDVEAAAVPYIVASAILELGYFAFLAAGYRRFDVSLVYPVARGGAPVLVLLGAVAAGHGASVGQIAGVVAVATGILLVLGIGGHGWRADAGGLLLGLAAAACIAGYMLVDKAGLEHAAPIPFLELVLVGPALVYAAVIWRLRGAAALRREATPGVALLGIVLFFTYVLVLFALQLAPAAAVSAVRETSVVIAAGLAAVLAHEHVTGRRFAGTGLVAVGVALVALSQ